LIRAFLLLSLLSLMSLMSLCAADGLRVDAFTSNGNVTSHSHGTAGAVDLAEFGLPGSRYCITAAHVCHDNEHITVEVQNKFLECRNVSCNEDLDICLLKCDADLPDPAKLSPDDGPVRISGSPKNKPVISLACCSIAAVLSCEPGMAHGMSGSPCYNKRGEIAGMVIGGVGDGRGEMRDDTAGIVGIAVLRKFLSQVNDQTARSEKRELRIENSLLTSQASLLIPCADVTATASPTDNASDLTGFIGRLFSDLLPLFGAAFLALSTFAAHKIAAKFHLDAIAGVNDLIDVAVAKGVNYADAWAASKTFKPMGSSKMENALSVIETIIGNPLFKMYGADHISKLVEAYLHNQTTQAAPASFTGNAIPNVPAPSH